MYESFFTRTNTSRLTTPDQLPIFICSELTSHFYKNPHVTIDYTRRVSNLYSFRTYESFLVSQKWPIFLATEADQICMAIFSLYKTSVEAEKFRTF